MGRSQRSVNPHGHPRLDRRRAYAGFRLRLTCRSGRRSAYFLSRSPVRLRLGRRGLAWAPARSRGEAGGSDDRTSASPFGRVRRVDRGRAIALEAVAQRLVILCVDSRVGDGSLRVLQQSLLPLVKRLTRVVEGHLRGRDDQRRRLNVGRGARQGLRVDVGEADLDQGGREEVEEALDRARDRVHGR